MGDKFLVNSTAPPMRAGLVAVLNFLDAKGLQPQY